MRPRKLPIADPVMFSYTDALVRLMSDIVQRVPDLSHVPMDRVLVFARPARRHTCGPNATCHTLHLPTTDPGYYFWTDAESGQLVRRTPWFVTRSPEVSIGGLTMAYLISVGMPRFAEQPAARKRHRYFDQPAWVCRLDTIIHELFHVAPDGQGLRQMTRPDGHTDVRSHPPAFFDAVELLVREYLGTGPDPDVLSVVRDELETLVARHGRLSATTFRPYPSYPQRYIEVLAQQPPGPDVPLVPVGRPRSRARYTDTDIVSRDITSLVTSSAVRAA